MGRSSLRGHKLVVVEEGREGAGRRRTRTAGISPPAAETVSPGPPEPPPEFSRPVSVDVAAAEGGFVLEITANAAEREALGRRLGLEGLTRLDAKLHLRPIDRGRMVRVKGRFEAEVIQICVVTLEPFAAVVTEAFSALFAIEAPAGVNRFEILFNSATVDDDDLPEPVENDRIDVGELVAQHLSLALDTHPRRPGASIPEAYAGTDPDDSRA
ncbi:conserved hypothetical protein [uncultured Gammaproteobacteria bacterium]